MYDSLRARPLAGAAVTVVRRSPEPQLLLSAITDSAGRYALDSLVAGHYSVGFATPFLDSLEILLPPRDTVLGLDMRLRMDFATPSRATLARAACPGVRLARGRGAIVGRVLDADSDAPLAQATVAVSWSDIGLDVRAMRATKEERVAALATDSLGQYRVCGVPTDTYVTLQVQRAGRVGMPVHVVAADSAGVMVRNLSLSLQSARTVDTTATVAEGTEGTEGQLPMLRGTASVTGIVRGPEGQPLANATVHVVDAAGLARSDAQGRFSLGELPGGTQLLEAKRLGYLIGQQPVDLRAGRATTQDVSLARIVVLDSVRVIAQRARIRDFDRRAASGNATGTLVTGAEIERRQVSETGQLFRGGRILGFSLVGDGVGAKVRSARGIGSFRADCDANIVIDGIQHQDINLVAPESIAGMEVYRGASGAPIEYESPCGVIVIWTRR